MEHTCTDYSYAGSYHGWPFPSTRRFSTLNGNCELHFSPTVHLYVFRTSTYYNLTLGSSEINGFWGTTNPQKAPLLNASHPYHKYGYIMFNNLSRCIMHLTPDPPFLEIKVIQAFMDILYCWSKSSCNEIY